MKNEIKLFRDKPTSYGSMLAIAVIMWYVTTGVLTGFFGVPRSIVYFGDLLNLLLFISALYKHKRLKIPEDYPLIFMICFALIGIVSAIINFGSPIMLLWGMRQNFKFFLFYYSCIIYVKERDLQILLKIMAILFWISLPLSVIEMCSVDTTSYYTIVGDRVGGIFYGGIGVNTPFNVLLIVHTTNAFVLYLNGKRKFSYIALTIIAALGMSACAELKVFIVELFLIIAIGLWSKGISFRSIFITFVGCLALGVALHLFVYLNARGRTYYTLDYLSIKGMIQNVTRSSGYDGTGDLNRFTAIPDLIKLFFKNDVIGLLFGVGLGNADYSGFDFLTSNFYKAYNALHYQWFSSSFVFIETGLLGLISYLMIFVSAMKKGLSKIDKHTYYRTFHFIMVVMMLLLIIYNPSLRNEQCGFLLFFILALPSIKKEDILSKAEMR